ncbi:Carbohydrate binding domain CBM49 [Cynara cardunculus var. scolymus]|uniref:Endoglucanase n=1 Tax=Cynara cardunculus var. scolymus TaxID=59895 RepID=A0A124SBV1_CYNCS|nr:Carbohydrate binding domain CBM49 [Cynara cardunculus var. scolymus]
MGIVSMATTLFLLMGVAPLALAGGSHNYGEALSKSILFFEAQRSGYLPGNQRVKWRGNSGLFDGKANGVDLVGGYYDAGDNVKFGLPMAFTVTMMAWSIMEYGKQMGESGELGHAMDAVGDGNTDHYCWQRPEDMTTSRNAYRIDQNNPGSDLAGETAAAMAAASIVFRRSNPAYSRELLTHAYQLFDFADKYRGKYDSSITVAQKYYRSVSGYADELLWGAAWLYKATGNEYYLDYLGKNGDALGGTGWAMTEFGWDVKYAGVQTLVAKVLLTTISGSQFTYSPLIKLFLMGGKAGNHAPVFGKYQEKAEFFMCSCLGKSSHNVQKTPGGLIFRQRWNNLQFVTSASFLLTVYSDYLTSARKSLQYNPRATSYMVGYGNNFPQQVHHRGSSIVSVKVNPSFVSCRGGYATWFSRKASDPNLLTGAIVGGPDAYDNFADHRDNYEQTEPATYNNAPLLGILARLHGGHGGYNQLLPVEIPVAKPIAVQPKPTPVKETSSAAPIAIEQKTTTSWVANGKTYYRYSVVVANKSSKTIKNLNLSVSKLYGPLWGLTKTTGGSYGFPTWVRSLPAGKTMEFVYIHTASPAEVSVSSYTLA